MENNLQGKIALITGASSGIGASFARFLSERHAHVILTARREERLAGIAQEIRAQGATVDYYACDISQADERMELVRSINAKVGQVDILINNAGFGWYGYYNTMEWKDAARMIAVNVEAAAHLTRLILPDMLARKSGHIINISSIAGGLPNQGIAIYAASKAFLDAFSTALYRELHGSGVAVSAMRLGPVETEFYEQAKSMKNGGAVPAEKLAIPVERVNRALGRLLLHPRRVIYVPAWLSITRLVEPLLGNLIDPLGPLLLRRG
jgi:uncharacterized protein